MHILAYKHLNEGIGDDEGRQNGKDHRKDVRHNKQRRHNVQEAIQEAPESVRNVLINRINVLAEAVLDSTHGGGIKEGGDGSAHDVANEAQVEDVGGSDHTEGCHELGRYDDGA